VAKTKYRWPGVKSCPQLLLLVLVKTVITGASEPFHADWTAKVAARMLTGYRPDGRISISIVSTNDVTTPTKTAPAVRKVALAMAESEPRPGRQLHIDDGLGAGARQSEVASRSWLSIDTSGDA
jgi:hypothetical protein